MPEVTHCQTPSMNARSKARSAVPLDLQSGIATTKSTSVAVRMLLPPKGLTEPRGLGDR
jgi:hypothetical protein